MLMEKLWWKGILPYFYSKIFCSFYQLKLLLHYFSTQNRSVSTLHLLQIIMFIFHNHNFKMLSQIFSFFNLKSLPFSPLSMSCSHWKMYFSSGVFSYKIFWSALWQISFSENICEKYIVMSHILQLCKTWI